MSLVIAGLIVTLIGKVATLVGYQGISLTAEQVITTFSTLAQLVGLAMAYIGRYRQGDITWYGKRYVK